MSKENNAPEGKKLQTVEPLKDAPSEKLDDLKKRKDIMLANFHARDEKFMVQEDLDKMKKIDEEIGKKKTQGEKLKSDTYRLGHDQRNLEAWANPKNKEQKGLLAGTVESLIDNQVESKFEQYLGKIREYGINDEVNIGKAKQAAKDIIYEHYLKTGNKLQDVTLPYVKKELGPKLREIFASLQQILAKKEYGYGSPVKLLEDFSAFTGLNFVKSGILQVEETKAMLRLQRPTLVQLVKNFQSSLDVKIDIGKFEGEKANLLGKKMELPLMFAEGRIKLMGPVRGTIGDNGKLDETVFAKNITAALPPNIDPKMKDAAIRWFMDESKKMSAQKGDVIELSEKGVWAKVDIVQEKKVQEDAKKKAGGIPEKSGAVGKDGKKEEKEQPIKTGNKRLDKFLNSITNLFSKIAAKIAPLSAKSKLGNSAQEFATLSDGDKKSALAFKGALNAMGLNMTTLSPLLKDDGEIKRILEKRAQMNMTWKTFLQKNLSAPEISQLKTAKTMQPKELSAMLLS